LNSAFANISSQPPSNAGISWRVGMNWGVAAVMPVAHLCVRHARQSLVLSTHFHPLLNGLTSGLAYTLVFLNQTCEPRMAIISSAVKRTKPSDQSDVQQGLVLLADPLPWEALDQLPAPEGLAGGPPPVWLALDEVQDPVRRDSVLIL